MTAKDLFDAGGDFVQPPERVVTVGGNGAFGSLSEALEAHPPCAIDGVFYDTGVVFKYVGE